LNKIRIGQDGETLAAAFLEKKGYTIVTRNFRLKSGEIDIIARRKQTVVFCEVKARNTREFGEPFEAVTSYKQKRLKRLALAYLQGAEMCPSENLTTDLILSRLFWARSRRSPTLKMHSRRMQLPCIIFLENPPNILFFYYPPMVY
jgi:putative endonuclease